MGGNASKEPTLVLVGLDSSGKTSILHRLMGHHITENPASTVGYNRERVRIGKKTVAKVIDLGGAGNVRINWSQYLDKCDGIVFVIDGTDSERFPEAACELQNVMKHSADAATPVMVLVNKQDVNGVCTCDEVIEAMNLRDIMMRRRWLIEACSTRYQFGYLEALKKLKHLVLEKK